METEKQRLDRMRAFTGWSVSYPQEENRHISDQDVQWLVKRFDGIKLAAEECDRHWQEMLHYLEHKKEPPPFDASCRLRFADAARALCNLILND